MLLVLVGTLAFQRGTDMAARIPWTLFDSRAFFDPTLGEANYIFPVNPSADTGGHGISKSTRYEAAASTYVDTSGTLRVDATVIQDAPDEQQTFSYTGNIYTEQQYKDFVKWFSKPYSLFLTDDLGRFLQIYVVNFSTERVRSAKYPWKHSYSFSGFVITET